MTTSRGFTANRIPTVMDFRNMDDIQRSEGRYVIPSPRQRYDIEPSQQRFSSIALRSNSPEYQDREKENGFNPQTSKSQRSKFCSKACLIGLAIGLAIGIVLVIVIAVPVGVILSSRTLGTISSTPNWVGTYQMDNTCNTALCCCFDNQITLSQISFNQLQVSGSVTGQCNAALYSLPLTTTVPTGFQTTLPWAGQSILLILGQDNSFLAFVNMNTKQGFCSASAVRTSYNAGNMKSMNFGLVLFILSITIAIMM